MGSTDQKPTRLVPHNYSLVILPCAGPCQLYLRPRNGSPDHSSASVLDHDPNSSTPFSTHHDPRHLPQRYSTASFLLGTRPSETRGAKSRHLQTPPVSTAGGSVGSLFSPATDTHTQHTHSLPHPRTIPPSHRGTDWTEFIACFLLVHCRSTPFSERVSQVLSSRPCPLSSPSSSWSSSHVQPAWLPFVYLPYLYHNLVYYLEPVVFLLSLLKLFIHLPKEHPFFPPTPCLSFVGKCCKSRLHPHQRHENSSSPRLVNHRLGDNIDPSEYHILHFLSQSNSNE